MTVYFAIISFSSEINKFLRNLNKVGYTLFLLFFWKFWYIYSFDYNTKVKNLERGIIYCLIGR